MDIDFKDKKSMFKIVIFILILFVLFQFVYFPKYKEAMKLNAEYRSVVKEIDDLYNFIGGQENLKENIIKIRKELALIENAFPSEKEVSDIVKQLNEEAKRFKISVRSLKPKNLSVYKDREGRELKLGDYFCKCMPLILDVEGKYQALGEFLMSLETNKGPLITIEGTELEKDEDISPKITAKIEMNAFILGK